LENFWNYIKPKGDPVMWFVIITLSAWGLLAVYSSTGALAYKKHGGNVEFYLFQQFLFLLGAFFIMLLTHSIHYKYFMGFAKLALYISYFLLVYTLFFGAEYNDAQRWIKIPLLGLSFQTSDVAKVALIIFLARELSRRQDDIKDFKKGFLPIIFHVTLICTLIAPSNLSTAIVLFVTSVVIMFFGRVRFKHILILMGPATIVLVVLVLVVMNTPNEQLNSFGRVLTWKNRIENFSSPKSNPDITYQNDHAKIAISTGGIFGKLPGNSTERNFLPEAYSDFIYAIIAEEYGFIGAVFMIILYLTFMYRTFRIILKSPKAFGALLALGLAFMLTFQALINMAVAVNIFPVTGLTLPLVSKGGTSILVTGFAFGAIMSVSRFIDEEIDSTQLI